MIYSNTVKKGGGGVKKALSIFFFALMVLVFVWETYGGIVGAIDVRNELAALAERGAGGHEYLGVGGDILALGMIFLSVIGFALALVSWKIAQYRVLRISSAVMYFLAWVPISICALIVML